MIINSGRGAQYQQLRRQGPPDCSNRPFDFRDRRRSRPASHHGRTIDPSHPAWVALNPDTRNNVVNSVGTSRLTFKTKEAAGLERQRVTQLA